MYQNCVNTTRKKVSIAQKGKGRQKKKVQHTSRAFSGEIRECSKDTEIFGIISDM